MKTLKWIAQGNFHPMFLNIPLFTFLNRLSTQRWISVAAPKTIMKKKIKIEDKISVAIV
jgi:hypothetical protein